MKFTDHFYDTFVAQGFSKLTECNAPSLAHEFENLEHWLTGFILNSAFGNPISVYQRRVYITILRKVQSAFIEYEAGRTTLETFVKTDKQKAVRLYFQALHHFELTLAMFYQGYDIDYQVGKSLPEEQRRSGFTRGDGSPIERLNSLYNTSRHTNLKELPEGNIHRVWITNSGLQSAHVGLTFVELADLLRGVGSEVQKLCRMEHKMSDTPESPSANSKS